MRRMKNRTVMRREKRRFPGVLGLERGASVRDTWTAAGTPGGATAGRIVGL
jgi:hypothetical protein